MRSGSSACWPNSGMNSGSATRARFGRAWCGNRRRTERDAAHLLDLLLQKRFPCIWIPSLAERDTRQLLRHRHKLVCFRTSVRNQLHALAMSQGVCRKKKLFTAQGREEWKNSRSIRGPAAGVRSCSICSIGSIR